MNDVIKGKCPCCGCHHFLMESWDEMICLVCHDWQNGLKRSFIERESIKFHKRILREAASITGSAYHGQ